MTSACIQWGPILTSVHLLVVHHRRCQRKYRPDATLYNEIYDVSIKFWFKAYFLEGGEKKRTTKATKIPVLESQASIVVPISHQSLEAISAQ